MVSFNGYVNLKVALASFADQVRYILHNTKSIHWGSYYEAFPDAERVFQEAFNAEDPASLLLNILKEHPTYFTLLDLLSNFVEAVHNDPYRAQTLASALAKIIHSPDAPSFGRDTLHDLLYREFADLFFEGDDDDNLNKVYGPRNTFLLDSLLSGFSFKYELTLSSDMYGFLNDGLKSPRGLRDSKLDPEVLVVGTSIQLLLSGSRMEPGELRNAAKKLKAHEAAGTVRDPHAIEVLKVRFLTYNVEKTDCSDLV